MSKYYDKIIIGAGLYGLYAARFCAERGDSVLVLEREAGAFGRATYINQARVHMGYHYPRSFSTAVKSKNYFERFTRDYGFCIADDFKQIYATSRHFSWTDRGRFIKFCGDAGIPCEPVSPDLYFQKGLCDGAYVTREYTYDAMLLRDHMMSDLRRYPNIEMRFSSEVTSVQREREVYAVGVGGAPPAFETGYLLNATYASCNEIILKAGFDPFRIKYELCEIILCEVNAALKGIGITVMDGPFFSIMPFGKTGLHSLTSVTFTPHKTSYDRVARFDCQALSGGHCREGSLGNCDGCSARPESARTYMGALAKKYLLPQYGFQYKGSLFSMKPILTASEMDDSRPTVIRVFSESPAFVSVLSGKINTVYDLDEVLSI